MAFITFSYADTTATLRDKLAAGGFGPSMQVIPPGQFVMGTPPSEPGRFDNEGPTHVVNLKRAFAISQYEITFEQYDLFADATHRPRPSDQGWGEKHWGRGDMPVFNVSWYDARAYTNWLSQQTGQTYRLATEAEWEYAARAGTQTPFTTGFCISKDDANFQGWSDYDGCPVAGLYRGETTKVGSFAANAWGLYDVHGNIFEWTQDCWHANFNGAPDDGGAWLNDAQRYAQENPYAVAPPALADCTLRVLKGGSWSGDARNIRLGQRSKNQATFKSIFIGIRVVRELSRQQSRDHVE